MNTEFLLALTYFGYLIAVLGVMNLGMNWHAEKPIKLWHGFFVTMVFVFLMFIASQAPEAPMGKMPRGEATMHLFAALVIYGFFFRMLRGPFIPPG